MSKPALQLVAVLVLAAAILGFGIDRASVGTAYLDPVGKLRTQDECTYANGALSAVDGGGWLTPKMLGRYLMYKPPLLVGLSGLSMKLLGVSLLALRLPSLMAAVAAVVVMFWWVARVRPGIVAWGLVVLLLSNPTWQALARLCDTDMLLTGFLVGALAVLYAAPRLDTSTALWGFAALTAGAVMAKSAAGLLPLLVLFLYWVLAGPLWRPRISRVVCAGAAVGLLAAPWHVYQLIVHRQWFLADYVGVQLLGFGLHPQFQSSGESQAAFYFKRLAFVDPALAVLVLLALPGLVAALRRREGALPALLAAWLVVAGGALLVFRYRNLPYSLYVIPALCLIAVHYGPLFAARRAKWGLLALCAIFGLKCYYSAQPWGLPFGAVAPLPATAELRSYRDLGRTNELILANPDDEFYSATLRLPRVRYYLFDPSNAVGSWSQHMAYLGIILSVEEFERIGQVQAIYAARLQSWGLDSADPIATVVLGRTEDALARLAATRPDVDFYVNGEDLKRLNQDTGLARAHQVVTLPSGHALLLARAAPAAVAYRMAPLLARW